MAGGSEGKKKKKGQRPLAVQRVHGLKRIPRCEGFPRYASEPRSAEVSLVESLGGVRRHLGRLQNESFSKIFLNMFLQWKNSILDTQAVNYAVKVVI